MSDKPWVGKKVLIVDDSLFIQDKLRLLYSEVGMQICGTAGTGIEALQRLQVTEPDLVSLDIIMPEMDGVECFQRIQKESPAVKMVMISCLGGESVVREGLRHIIPPYLFQSKDLSRVDLEDRLVKVFTGREHERHEEPRVRGQAGSEVLDYDIKVS